MTHRNATPRIAVVGAGLIGKRHVEAIIAAGAPLHSVTDPDPSSASIASACGVPRFSSLEETIRAKPDGIVLATPNVLHEEGALACIAAGIPVLVEKPLASTVAAARRIVDAAETRNVPVLTGHHRRHSGIIRRAREIIGSGALGRIVSVHASFWLAKPDSYFETDWRRRDGAGPLLLNLIHDVDLMRHLVGEISTLEAYASNAVRGFDVEDSFVAIARFANGALGTIQVSDTIVAPWSWELTAHDNPAYPPTDQNALLIGGTLGSLALPRGEFWSDNAKRNWWEPISRTTLPRDGVDPLVAQMRNFMGVIEGREEPVCSGADGLASLEALHALKDAAVFPAGQRRAS